MKRFIFLAAILSIFISCSKQPLSPDGPGGGLQTKSSSTYISPETARKNLEDFMSAIKAQTKSGEERIIASMHILGDLPQTKGDSLQTVSNEPLVYLFNFANDRGFSIVPGDTRMPEVLFYVDEGHLDPEIPIDNPGLALYLEAADTYYRIRTGMPITDINDGITQIYPGDPDYPDDNDNDDGSEHFGTQVPVTYEYGSWFLKSYIGSEEPFAIKWDQESPFNKYCFTANEEQAYAGCVPIAVAQLMYYYGKNWVFDKVYYNWDTLRTVTSYNTGSENAKDKVAKLIYQLGLKCNLDVTYGSINDTLGSSAYSKNAGRTFKNFGYSDKGIYADYNVEKGLASGPMLVRGSAIKKIYKYNFLGFTIQRTTYSSGHAWVISQEITMQREKQAYTGKKLINTEYETRKYVHCNWGWGGNHNGYFYSGVFDAINCRVNPENPDTKSIEGQKYYYRYQLSMHYGMKP